MAAPGLNPSPFACDDWDIGDNVALYTTPSSYEDSETSETEPQDSQEASQSTQPSQGHELPETGKGLGAWNTPIAYTENSAQTFGFHAKKAEARNKRLGSETSRTAVGPMPVKDFLSTFFGCTPDSFDDMPSSTNAFMEVPADASREADLYEPLIEAINAKGGRKSRCPGFTFRDTSNHPDTSGGQLGAKKPDVCCYADHHLPAVRSKKRNSLASRTDMGLAATYIEIKAKPSQDVFYDPPFGVDGTNRATWPFVFNNLQGELLNAALEVLGQHTTYASEVAMRQQRLCVYSITMSGTVVRLLRWDRAGVIVSEAFSIHINPEYLCQFLWCFSQVSDTERGYDLTTAPARDEDEAVFRACIEKHIQVQLGSEVKPEDSKKALDEHFSPGVVTSIFVSRKVQGLGNNDTIPYEYLVSRPVVAPLSMVGRGTRAYWAVDSRTREVLYLKDTWRSGTREGEIIEELRDSGVLVPPLVYHGDVPIGIVVRGDSGGQALYLDHGRSQRTMTDSFLKAPWVCGHECDDGLTVDAVVRRTRYRLVSKYAGYSLERLKGTAELLNGVHDAFQGESRPFKSNFPPRLKRHFTHDVNVSGRLRTALHRAYVQCQRVHRNISPANIILYNDDELLQPRCRQAFLIDWELSCKANVPGRRISPLPLASVTWQFLSASAAMRRDGDCYRVQDDVESLFWVVMYCALLYLPHNMNNDKLLELLNTIFDRRVTGHRASHPREPITTDGESKFSDIHFERHTYNITWPNAALSRWIDQVRLMIRVHFHGKPMGPHHARQNWTPSQFATLWSKFFEQYPVATIDNSDRTDHVFANKASFSSVAPRNALRTPVQATMAYSPPKTASSHTLTLPWSVKGNTAQLWRSPGTATSPSSIVDSTPSLPTHLLASGSTGGSAPRYAAAGLSEPLGALSTSALAAAPTPALVPAVSPTKPVRTFIKSGKMEPREKRKTPPPDGDDSTSTSRPKKSRGTDGVTQSR